MYLPHDMQMQKWSNGIESYQLITKELIRTPSLEADFVPVRNVTL